jgi:hypothetical protein
MDESEARKALLDELGGRHTIAKDLGVGATAISNWLKDGFPRSRIPRLLQIARERGVKDVTLDRLIQMVGGGRLMAFFISLHDREILKASHCLLTEPHWTQSLAVQSRSAAQELATATP